MALTDHHRALSTDAGLTLIGAVADSITQTVPPGERRLPVHCSITFGARAGAFALREAREQCTVRHEILRAVVSGQRVG